MSNPSWHIDGKRWFEIVDLASDYHAPISMCPSVRAVVANLRSVIRETLRAYDGARTAYYVQENALARIREGFAIHETPSGGFDLYMRFNSSPIIGWKQHPFVAYLNMAVTTSAIQPPPKCDICGELQTKDWHV